MTLWDHLTNVTYNKSSWDSISDHDKKSWTTFMINRFLSMNEDYIELVNYFQRFYNLSPKNVYNFYKSTIPRKKFFTPYIKSSKSEKSDNIKYISKYYKVSEREAEDYSKMLSDETIEIIINSLGIQQKSKKNGKIKPKTVNRKGGANRKKDK